MATVVDALASNAVTLAVNSATEASRAAFASSRAFVRESSLPPGVLVSSDLSCSSSAVVVREASAT